MCETCNCLPVVDERRMLSCASLGGSTMPVKLDQILPAERECLACASHEDPAKLTEADANPDGYVLHHEDHGLLCRKCLAALKINAKQYFISADSETPIH